MGVATYEELLRTPAVSGGRGAGQAAGQCRTVQCVRAALLAERFEQRTAQSGIKELPALS